MKEEALKALNDALSDYTRTEPLDGIGFGVETESRKI
jgi:hypothetical protein